MDTEPGVDEDYQDFLDRYVFGDVWCRDGLDLRTRSCVTVAMLTAMGRISQLRNHLRAAPGNGVTIDELKEIIFHSAVYCGVALAADAFKALDEVIADLHPRDS